MTVHFKASWSGPTACGIKRRVSRATVPSRVTCSICLRHMINKRIKEINYMEDLIVKAKSREEAEAKAKAERASMKALAKAPKAKRPKGFLEELRTL